MGSGKSYELMCSVILPAFKKGRRIVTNIDGISEEKIREYLIEKNEEETQFGQITHVRNEDLNFERFFPTDDQSQDSIVKYGDLVCIDEAWRFWGIGVKISENHMQFFRMHRHYIHPETGVSCDIALVIQSVSDLQRSIKSVVEINFKMTKLKMLGLNRSYRIELFEGASTSYSKKFQTFNRNYDKRIFPLYKSYASNGQGVESSVDKRQNIFTSPSLWFIAAGVITIFYFSSTYLWRLFNPVPIQSNANNSKSTPSSTAQIFQKPEDESSVFRVAGNIDIDGFAYVVLIDNEGVVRLENSQRFVGQGTNLIGTYKGSKVSTWTGQRIFANQGVMP